MNFIDILFGRMCERERIGQFRALGGLEGLRFVISCCYHNFTSSMEYRNVSSRVTMQP